MYFKRAFFSFNFIDFRYSYYRGLLLLNSTLKRLNSGIKSDIRPMADKLMYIPNDDIQNYPYCILQLVIKTF